MKRLAVLLTIFVVMISLVSVGLAVPSISTNDTTTVTDITTSTGVKPDDGFRLFLVESPPAIEQQIGKFYSFTTNPENPQPPAEFFSEQDQQKIEAVLPDDMPMDSLLVNEIVSAKIVNYDIKYGDVNIEFEFATTYEEGKIVSVLLGLTHADPSVEWDEEVSWDDNTDWFMLEAIALENGHLLVLFPENILLDMGQALCIEMVVFNEQ